MGAIFNKLASGRLLFLKNCRDQVTSYFQQYRPTSKAFGFLPVFPKLGGDDAMDHLDNFFRTFAEHVDVKIASWRLRDGFRKRGHHHQQSSLRP
jgi:hypothetical protein